MSWFVFLGQKMHKKSINIFDLDGTILKGNSFHSYVIFLFKSFVLSGRFIKAFSLLWLLGLRKARRLDHYQLKQGVINIAAGLSAKKNEKFARRLANQCNQRLSELSASYNDKDECRVLATAAPWNYAQYLKGFLKFDLVIASEYIDDVYIERIRENKADAIEEMLRQYSAEFSTFFTDHHDDIFAARLASRVILVDPNEKTVQKFDDEKINYLLHRFAL